jgi:hypothetical protein
MEELKKIVEKYPNDMELGRVIRKMVNETVITKSTKKSNLDVWYIREDMG